MERCHSVVGLRVHRGTTSKQQLCYFFLSELRRYMQCGAASLIDDIDVCSCGQQHLHLVLCACSRSDQPSLANVVLGVNIGSAR